eukprot:1161820-Pelagomonas_calceolata.AAC.2
MQQESKRYWGSQQVTCNKAQPEGDTGTGGLGAAHPVTRVQGKTLLVAPRRACACYTYAQHFPFDLSPANANAQLLPVDLPPANANAQFLPSDLFPANAETSSPTRATPRISGLITTLGGLRSTGRSSACTHGFIHMMSHRWKSTPSTRGTKRQMRQSWYWQHMWHKWQGSKSGSHEAQEPEKAAPNFTGEAREAASRH